MAPSATGLNLNATGSGDVAPNANSRVIAVRRARKCDTLSPVGHRGCAAKLAPMTRIPAGRGLWKSSDRVRCCHHQRPHLARIFLPSKVPFDFGGKCLRDSSSLRLPATADPGATRRCCTCPPWVHKHTSAYVCATSALPPVSDLDRKSLNVRDVPKPRHR
jgi:hypothetical protein